MGGRGDGPGDGLGIDVPLIGQGKALIPKRPAEFGDGRARHSRHQKAAGVDPCDPGQFAQVEQHAVGLDDRSEGMTGAGGAYAVTVGDRGRYLLTNLVLRPSHDDFAGGEALIADPVAPGGGSHRAGR